MIRSIRHILPGPAARIPGHPCTAVLRAATAAVLAVLVAAGGTRMAWDRGPEMPDVSSHERNENLRHGAVNDGDRATLLAGHRLSAERASDRISGSSLGGSRTTELRSTALSAASSSVGHREGRRSSVPLFVLYGAFLV